MPSHQPHRPAETLANVDMGKIPRIYGRGAYRIQALFVPLPPKRATGQVQAVAHSPTKLSYSHHPHRPAKTSANVVLGAWLKSTDSENRLTSALTS